MEGVKAVSLKENSLKNCKSNQIVSVKIIDYNFGINNKIPIFNIFYYSI